MTSTPDPITPRLRVAHVLVQPVFMWDDGTVLTPAAPMNAQQLTVPELVETAANLSGDLETIAEQLRQQEAAQRAAQTIQTMPNGDPIL